MLRNYGCMHHEIFHMLVIIVSALHFEAIHLPVQRSLLIAGTMRAVELHVCCSLCAPIWGPGARQMPLVTLSAGLATPGTVPIAQRPRAAVLSAEISCA